MTDEQVWVCQACHHTLELYTDTEGFTFRHTVQDADDHVVIPTLADGDMAPRCDFCNIDEAAYWLPVRDFEMLRMPEDEPIHQSTGSWSACTECARLIETNRWSALVRRHGALAAEQRGEPLPDDVLAAVAAMYRKLRKHISGPLKPV